MLVVTANTTIFFGVKYFNNNLTGVSEEHVASAFSVEE
jgi:hypothetical protein